MSDGAAAVETFLEAAELNRSDPLLVGSTLSFPNYGQLVMTGDLHGHRRNFQKLKWFCNLEQAGARHVVLHEIIHEEVATLDGLDTSHEVQLWAAKWKCEFPDQVHFLQSNHELAQLNRQEITKNGRIVTVAFEESIDASYPGYGARVLDAINEFIQSLPLAGRTANRVFLSHSLPSPHDIPSFDRTVLDRVPTSQDLTEGGAGHRLVWGRYHTEQALIALSHVLDVDVFMCGHQPQEMGYTVLHDRMIILASDHNHGVFLPFDLSKPAHVNDLEKRIKPYAGVM